MADSNERLPEEMDERHQRLIDNLRLLYSMDGQKAQHLTRIHQRLLNNELSPSHLLDRDASDNLQRLGELQTVRSHMVQKSFWRHQLSMIAAVLVVALLGSTFLLVLNMSHRRGAGGTSAKPEGGFSTVLSFHMVDASKGWVLTEQAVFSTADGGVHWKNVSPPDITRSKSSIADFRTASIASIATPRSDGASTQVLHTSDGGSTWQQATIPLPFPRQISFVDAEHGWVLAAVRPPGGAAEPISVFRTVDGGKTWSNVATALFSDATPPGRLPYGGQKTGMHFLNSSTGWVTGSVSLPKLAWLYITHDSGSTWQQQALLIPPGVPSALFTVLAPTFFSAVDGILPVIFSDVSTSHALATAIYTTHDGGKTWQSTAPVSAALPILSFADMQYGWATDGTVLYSTDNGGHHWMKLFPNESFKNIAQLDFISDKVGWAISSSASTSTAVLKTVDGGRTWTTLSSTRS